METYLRLSGPGSSFPSLSLDSPEADPEADSNACSLPGSRRGRDMATSVVDESTVNLSGKPKETMCLKVTCLGVRSLRHLQSTRLIGNIKELWNLIFPEQ